MCKQERGLTCGGGEEVTEDSTVSVSHEQHRRDDNYHMLCLTPLVRDERREIRTGPRIRLNRRGHGRCSLGVITKLAGLGGPDARLVGR